MKYKIGVDVDGVLRDFPKDLFRVIEREHPEWLIKTDSDSFRSFCFDSNHYKLSFLGYFGFGNR